MTDQPRDQPRRCVATAKSTGQRCGRAPIPGGDVCKIHGGGAPQVRIKAAQRQLAKAVEADARAVLAHHGITGITDPLDELTRVAREIVAFKDALAARVNALDERIRFTDDRGSEQLRSEVALFERAMDRCVKVLDVLAKSNIEERRLARDERLLDQVEQLVRAALTQLALTPAQWEQVPAALEHGLRAIEGGKA